MIGEFFKVVFGMMAGIVILAFGFIVYGILMVNKDDSPLSKRKKAFGSLAAVVILGLGIWPLYIGIITDDKFLSTMGSFIVILSIVMVAIIPTLNRSDEEPYRLGNPLDYED